MDDTMTNEEAIEILRKVTFYWEPGDQTLTLKQIHDAFDMAVKALNQQSKIDRWLTSFNTDSTRECFSAIQRLKMEVTK